MTDQASCHDGPGPGSRAQGQIEVQIQCQIQGQIEVQIQGQIQDSRLGGQIPDSGHQNLEILYLSFSVSFR